VSRGLKIGVLWCTFFKRRSNWRQPLQLLDAYRPPSLFASQMRDAGHDVEFLMCDDILQSSDLDGATRKLQDSVELLYVMTHGDFAGTGYDVYLHADNWRPGATGIGHTNLAVAIFDTCKLIDTQKGSNWQAIWARAKIGAQLRLMLGFDGPVVIDRASALRGKAFAENLINGSTFAESWLEAVRQTCSNSKHRKAVAIGIGDTRTDAEAVLDTADLASIPAARGAGSPFFMHRY